MKHIYFTVTNDLSYDQRMQRICTSLSNNGFEVTLVGRHLKKSIELRPLPFFQKRIYCWFTKGKLFYLEYNIRLFFFLLSKKMDGICAIDLDTILPCLYISRLKKIPRIYDAHEFFTELKEVRERPFIQKIWKFIEKKTVPKFKYGYTVSESIAIEFRKRYQVEYNTIRNMPVTKVFTPGLKKEKFILYQGAVNEGRGFEFLIPAMLEIPVKLIICGDGNFMPQLKQLIIQYKLTEKVELKGMLPPEELLSIARDAYIGIAVPEREGINQYLALPNKFFDYLHCNLPQVTVDYPEYRKLNDEFGVAVLIKDLKPSSIAFAVNNLLNDSSLYTKLQTNCTYAKTILCWENEETKLLNFYNNLFSN